MPVKGKKLQAVKVMLQDDRRPVIAKIIVIIKAVNFAVERRINRYARLAPYINAQVKAARFIVRVKQWAARIYGSVLHITADAVTAIISLKRFVYPAGKFPGVRKNTGV